MGVSEVNLAKRAKRAKDESGGERVLNYAKTITHNLIPLMKTTKTTDSIGDSLTRENSTSSASVASSKAVPERAQKGGTKAWSFANMIPKTNSKESRVRKKKCHKEKSRSVNDDGRAEDRDGTTYTNATTVESHADGLLVSSKAEQSDIETDTEEEEQRQEEELTSEEEESSDP